MEIIEMKTTTSSEMKIAFEGIVSRLQKGEENVSELEKPIQIT